MIMDVEAPGSEIISSLRQLQPAVETACGRRSPAYAALLNQQLATRTVGELASDYQVLNGLFFGMLAQITALPSPPEHDAPTVTTSVYECLCDVASYIDNNDILDRLETGEGVVDLAGRMFLYLLLSWSKACGLGEHADRLMADTNQAGLALLAAAVEDTQEGISKALITIKGLCTDATELLTNFTEMVRLLMCGLSSVAEEWHCSILRAMITVDPLGRLTWMHTSNTDSK